MAVVKAVIHPGEICNPARWKTMHQDVINHFVPVGSQKEGRKKTGFAVLLGNVKKGSSKTADARL